MEKTTVRTARRKEFVEITGIVDDMVRKFGVKGGVCHVYVPHTTCGLTINENADPSVKADIISMLDRLVPENAGYTHSEGNSDAHIKSSLLGHSVSLIIADGSLLLGTWQGVFLCEFDGPRTRQILVEIVSR